MSKKKDDLSGDLCNICGVDTAINGLRYSTFNSYYQSKYFCAKCVKQGEHVVEKKVCSHCAHELEEKTKFVVMQKEVPVIPSVKIVRGKGMPDVYYGYGSGTHSEENIADPQTGEPIPFWDKASKREAMRRAGVIEAGDRVHGARNEDMHPSKRKTYI